MKILYFLGLIGWSFVCQAGAAPDLLLAQSYTHAIDVRRYWISEKLDGVRAYWDGQRLISRGGNVFNAPAWFTAQFPKQALDGELWLARGQFAETVALLSQDHAPDSQWRKLSYNVFELPNGTGTFSDRLEQLKQIVGKQKSPYLKLIPQFRLDSKEQLFFKLHEITQQGAEGLVLHYADALYSTGRNGDLLKLKPYQDAEATIVAYRKGKGKYTDMLGSLLVKSADGKVFAIGSGLSDELRQSPPPIGTVITYQYNGLTKNGLPRFARFLRIRSDGL